MVKLQIGKHGLSSEFIEQVRKLSENIENIRISILKSACRDRDEFQEIAKKIVTELGPKYTAKIIGYTIILKKWRKARSTN